MMSNERYNETSSSPAATPPATTGTEAKGQNPMDPNVPITADLPVLPEFRAPKSAGVVQAINRRAALSAASLAAFLAALAGIGCGTKTTMRKPSPAIPLAGSTPALSASAGHNFGPVTR